MLTLQHRRVVVNLATACVGSVLCAGVLGGCKNRQSHMSAQVDGGNARNNRLLSGAARGYPETVDESLMYGADVNTTDGNGRTALHLAASNGHDEMVDYLVSRGAKVNAQDKSGNTPLHYAAKFGHEDTVRRLRANGADVTVRNAEGKTAAESATGKAMTAVVD